jgi:hypothetical protein
LPDWGRADDSSLLTDKSAIGLQNLVFSPIHKIFILKKGCVCFVILSGFACKPYKYNQLAPDKTKSEPDKTLTKCVDFVRIAGNHRREQWQRLQRIDKNNAYPELLTACQCNATVLNTCGINKKASIYY